MQDQVAYLRSLGLLAIPLHDEQLDEQLEEQLRGVEKAAFPCLFALPEKMLCVE